MDITDPNNKFGKWLTICFAIAMAIVLSLVLSSCKLIHEASKGKTEKSTDSVSVKKDEQEKSKVDTSKTKSESTKETVYYPQPIIVEGKGGETKVVFVPQSVKETNSQENQNAIFENWKQNLYDSLLRSEITKEKEKETKTVVKTDWLTIGILVALGLLLFKNFI